MHIRRDESNVGSHTWKAFTGGFVKGNWDAVEDKSNMKMGKANSMRFFCAYCPAKVGEVSYFTDFVPTTVIFTLTDLPLLISRLIVGVSMRAVNNRPPIANRYNRQPLNRLTAITV
jgi:hypothetical protein